MVGWLIHIYPYYPLTNHPTFIIMISFNQLWQLFLSRGALASQYAEAEQLWQSYSPDIRQQIYDTINQKLHDGRFIHFVPVVAIRENTPHQPRAFIQPPTNYAGKPLPRGGEYYFAEYNGQRGLYKAEDVKAHNMLNPEKFEI